MAQNSPLILRLIASSVTVASRAGKIIRDVLNRGELGIVEKKKNDLQTEADRSAQRCIITSLTRQFPGLTVIGEEGLSSCEVPSDFIVTDCDQSVLSHSCPGEYENLNLEDVVVWVDPLDGTLEYTQGLLEHVTVLIGVAVKGHAVGGVMHQPYYKPPEDQSTTGRTLWGLVGLGVGGFTPLEPPQGKLLIATTRSHYDQVVKDALDSLKADEIIRVGGAGYKVLMLMEGKAHAYVFASKGCKKWDICAPDAILTALGGKFTDIHGKPYIYHKDVEHANTGGVFATAKGVDHSALISKLPKEVLDQFP